jgi:transcriptional regulator with XRE-family HTH domain
MPDFESKKKTTGEKLQALRRHRNLSCEKMAAIMGITKSGYLKKEDADTNFEQNTIIVLSEILEVGPDYFFLELSPEDYDNYKETKPLFYEFIHLTADQKYWLIDMLKGAKIIRNLREHSADQARFTNSILPETRASK